MDADIIRMAREAEQYADKFCNGIGDSGQHHWFDAYNARFAELVRAAEREACAQIADRAEPYQAADLIRARKTNDNSNRHS